MKVPRKLWEHPAPDSTRMAQFKASLAEAKGIQLDSFQDLHTFSITDPSAFWDFLFKSSGIIHHGSYASVVDSAARMDSIPRWFTGAKLNFAENMLFAGSGTDNGNIAVTEANETGPDSAKHTTWGTLRRKVGALSQAMRANGVVKGTRVAVCACNSLDTLVVFLATTVLGGIFSSCSTDLGVDGILERLQQIQPRWLFMDDTALYNGKLVDMREKMANVVAGMTSIAAFEGVVAQPRLVSPPKDVSMVPRAQRLDQFLATAGSHKLEFEYIDFADPFLIVYSSGTTGRPKCIVHSVGGVLLNGFKEGALHQDFGPSSVVLQYTTTSWIMYLASIQNLCFGSRAVLYDGSPFLPAKTSLMELCAQERVTHFGTSPRYCMELQKAGIAPREQFDLTSLQVVTPTGMVFPDDLFEWFYDRGFPPSVRLNNMSGGTDIAGCFGIGNTLSPVYVGGCSGLSLGVNVQVYDTEPEGSHVQGRPVEDGVSGELIAKGAFPNMPVMFWGDDGAERYHNAYFARFDDVWTHGDFVMIHPVTKQLMFMGRSDGVLNPSGVRFGSAEIYEVLERHFAKEITDAICVGQRRPGDTDEKVFLFLLLSAGVTFTKDLVDRVKAAIRTGLSPRHVPAYVFPTPAIPSTINGKKVELPVKRIISGDKMKPSGTLANPESLDYFYQFVRIEELGKRESKL